MAHCSDDKHHQQELTYEKNGFQYQVTMDTSGEYNTLTIDALAANVGSLVHRWRAEFDDNANPFPWLGNSSSLSVRDAFALFQHLAGIRIKSELNTLSVDFPFDAGEKDVIIRLSLPIPFSNAQVAIVLSRQVFSPRDLQKHVVTNEAAKTAAVLRQLEDIERRLSKVEFIAKHPECVLGSCITLRNCVICEGSPKSPAKYLCSWATKCQRGDRFLLETSNADRDTIINVEKGFFSIQAQVTMDALAGDELILLVNHLKHTVHVANNIKKRPSLCTFIISVTMQLQSGDQVALAHSSKLQQVAIKDSHMSITKLA